jgi:hypothetical protein
VIKNNITYYHTDETTGPLLVKADEAESLFHSITPDSYDILEKNK